LFRLANKLGKEEFEMRMMKRLLLGVGLLAVSAGIAAAAPAVVQTNLTLRAGPGPRYAPVATLPAGTTVDVGSCTGRWCQVAFEGGQGYANRAYLGIGSAAVGDGYGPNYVYSDGGYYEPDYYYGDDSYYTYGVGGGGIWFGGGRRHFRDHDHQHGQWNRGQWDNRTRTSNFNGNQNFPQRSGAVIQQGNPQVRSGRSFSNQNVPRQNFSNQNVSRQNFSGQSFGGNRPSAPSATVGAGASMSRSTVGSGAPMGGGGGGAKIGGGGGGGFSGHAGGGGGGGHGGHR
jgi:Bacterial SH3 domain